MPRTEVSSTGPLSRLRSDPNWLLSEPARDLGGLLRADADLRRALHPADDGPELRS